MTALYDTQDFYKKMLELQERLRKSEDERMKLEERFNLLSQESRNRRETCINNLRMRYIDFLEEQRLRDERNHQILGALDKIDGSLARMTARTDRLGILRKQYEAYLLRVYANRTAGGGTGDSGVGSHNEDRSPKTNISQSEINPTPIQRTAPQNAGISPSFIPQTNYPQSYIGASNISQFNVPRYTSGQETPQVHVMQAQGQGDGSRIVQPQRIPQQFCGSQNLNTSNTSVFKAQPIRNISQEFSSRNRSYPHQFDVETFLPSNHHLAPNYGQVQHQRHDISNNYLENPRSSYAGDPSIVCAQNFTDSRGIVPSNLQALPDLQSSRANARAMANFSADLTDEAFGPYRHSTPLPGYLDYSTRYSRDPSIHEPEAAPRYEFTRSDLEKVIDRNEPILPKDYLHNPETVKPVMQTSKISSLLENKQRISDVRPGKGLNDDELDQYINRIRSLHRDNGHSPEVLDIEQNTSGDLLNATLSDDGPEQLTLQSDDRINPNEGKILTDDIKSVFALADDFIAQTGNLGDGSKFNSDSSNRNILPESVFSPQIRDEHIVAKPTLVESNDVSLAVLKADMTSDNLSISVTRDDILSETASIGVNPIQDTSAVANGKFRPDITPPIADLEMSRPNITDIAASSQNNLVESKEFSPNERGGDQVMSSSSQEYNMKMLGNKSDLDEEVSLQRTSTEVPNGCIQSVIRDHGFLPKETEVHEDIEGDKVSLIEREQVPEQVIDVVKELQPPSLQHYEKNFVEIHVGNEDKKDASTRKVVPDGIAGPKIEETGDIPLRENLGAGDAVETSSHENSITNKDYAKRDVTDQKYSGREQTAEQTLNFSEKEINKDEQYQDDVEPKYKLNPSLEKPTYEHQPEQNLPPDDDEERDASQTYEQNPQQLYDPATSEQLNYDPRRAEDESDRPDQSYGPESDEPYDSNQIYDANQQYETDQSQRYAQESNPQFAYDPSQHFEDDGNRQYADDPNQQYRFNPDEQYAAASNEQYKANPNEQYMSDPNEQYAADPNVQYADDPDAQYAADPNAQYAPDSNEQYANGNEQYATNPNDQYTADPNEQYATDPTQQYPTDSNQQYATDPNEGYTADPHEQYDYYENQRYENDPNATYQNAEHEQYDYVTDQGYQHDPNQQYEQDPNQQYVQDPNQQYEHDPNQQYEHDTNEYKEHEYEQNQSAESAGYEEPTRGGNQQFENDSQQDYAGRHLELQSSNQDYPTSAAAEKTEIQAATSDSYIQKLSDADDIEAKEYSADGTKKSKDVIRALLESDTESTIERNPSNNTESDFDFN